ncbi:hypothetical protein FQP87_22200 [Vibrio tasmaniensis]|nr:hypothetical protein FQP87_22200 [Vibrio tasmaniensis]
MKKTATAMWPLRKAREMVDSRVVTSIEITSSQSNSIEKEYTIVFLTRFKQQAGLRTSHSKVSKNREKSFSSEEEAKLFVSENFKSVSTTFTCESA